MSTNQPDITFRDVTVEDLPILRQWISQPHWQQWWGDVDVEIGYIQAMLDGEDTTRPYIFQVDGVDCGYIQYWIVADQLFEPWLSQAPWLTEMPKEAIGVDLSIGDAQQLSKGIGTRVLRAFVEGLARQGFKSIIIDPDINNQRAVAAYTKAGFAPIESQTGKNGDTLLMAWQG